MSKRIIFFWFLKLLGFSMVIYLLFFKLSENREVAKTITMMFIGGYSFFMIQKDNQIEKTIRKGINYKLILLILIVVALFIANNIFQMRFLGMDFGYNKLSLPLYYLYFLITSTAEEILYRGYIQRKLEANNPNNHLISEEIIYSSILMLITHLGFLYTMTLPSAISSLLIVAIFSISAGILMKHTNNLMLPIILHILVNWIHLTLAVTLLIR